MPPTPKTLYRIRPRGFCAGVVRAIEIVDLALQAYGAPIYVLHEIVHNRYVVEDLAAKGAVFVNHLEAIKFAREGYAILLIGDLEHDEVEGTSGEAPQVTTVVSSVAEADRVAVPDPRRVVYLTQTTLSQYDTAEIIARLRQRFPEIKGPPADDICYATQNRQEAVETVGRRAELVLVVGSANSANSNRLVEVAQRAGARAYLIEDENAIDAKWLDGVSRVALTAGASAPDVLVEQVSRRLEAMGFTQVEDVEIIPEDVRFTLPSELVPFAAAR